jgi:large subunit ribosomal protein L17
VAKSRQATAKAAATEATVEEPVDDTGTVEEPDDDVVEVDAVEVDEAEADEVEADEAPDDAADEDAPYGPGSHAALDDDSQPEGFDIKGNADSMLYHVPGSRSYSQTKAEVWFATEADAEAAGFAKPPSQRTDDETEEDA